MKELRKRKNLSQERLARKSGLHRTYISDIERGARNVSLKNIEKIAKALNISIIELF
ncbi:MAG: Transcriptional regulator, XRE family [Candidatus Kaiserbacteria bacterium GW2011_GWA2_49_19]|uniref:Transcriptional regulator, XRE family n=1 Tax=Candidatus Kaiserbacteria bacterium GW2011_GWA2_49_19 TaxID=1618669 RepID=A0A0G1VSS7_9BACT|nr:MAG: Transcriptional regulator, XRE family [Candidatus Kaiserbacteria bacterium GW2011_GWA2_49_19]